MKCKKKKGFTLIELIIVVAIIGILAAIAVPKFSDVQKKAKISADIASAKVIADAAILYYAENGTDTTSISLLSLQSVPTSQLFKDKEFELFMNSGSVVIKVEDKETTPTKWQVYPQVNKTDTNQADNPYAK